MYIYIMQLSLICIRFLVIDTLQRIELFLCVIYCIQNYVHYIYSLINIIMNYWNIIQNFLLSNV